jgi:hypothetical protein
MDVCINCGVPLTSENTYRGSKPTRCKSCFKKYIKKYHTPESKKRDDARRIKTPKHKEYMHNQNLKRRIALASEVVRTSWNRRFVRLGLVPPELTKELESKFRIFMFVEREFKAFKKSFIYTKKCEKPPRHKKTYEDFSSLKTKTCSDCGIEYDISEFPIIERPHVNKNGTTSIYYSCYPYCHVCKKNHTSSSYTTKDRHQYYLDNKEHIIACVKAWKTTHHDVVRANALKNDRNSRKEFKSHYIRDIWKHYKDFSGDAPELTKELEEELREYLFKMRELRELKKQFNQKKNGNNR